MSLATAILAAAVGLPASGCRKKPPAPVEIVATPEVAQTGLVPMLVARFQQQSGVKTNLRVVPANEALRLANQHSVQVVLTDETRADKRYARVARLVSPFAFHDFAIFGPARDPARVRTAGRAVDALRRIKKNNARFCSAVDVAPIQQREEQLWSSAGIDVKALRRRSDCHGDVVAALREADRKSAYTLTESKAGAAPGMNLDIKPLLVSSSDLHDEYSVVLVDHTPRIRRDKDAEWFVQWLMSYQGRDAVQNYRVDGVQRFSVRDAQGTQ